MSLHREHQYFDVIGSGFVHERHADECRHRIGDRDDEGASSSVLGWLAFYVLTALVVASSNEAANTAAVVLASAQ